ncbi:integral membrane protein 2C isoform X2 [Anabrus simplex]|uniref:integral membrane protein 2C isoform X2 n=1 Tax=Anabrus simplex TaxID=316456 RepID=UPI0034DDC007
MTVITKPITDKKADKLEEPLVENEQLPDLTAKVDLEASTEPQYFILRSRARRVSTATTVCLFLTALLVMSIGIIGGVYLYRQFARSQMQRFRGWCSIPYDGTKATMYQEDRTQQNSLIKSQEADEFGANDANKLTSFFKEEFEMNLETNDYEKIDVPDFRGGRRGRFIHDFNSNKTGIIDLDNHRCFVMPLNRQRVLPPRSLFDLIRKMWDGYYEVDTEVVRETMRVVTPPISDMKAVGYYISRDCKSYPTYMLEKVEQPAVYKRSILEDTKFAEFAGKSIVQLDIINMNEVAEYEDKNLQNSA